MFDPIQFGPMSDQGHLKSAELAKQWCFYVNMNYSVRIAVILIQTRHKTTSLLFNCNPLVKHSHKAQADLICDFSPAA